MPKMQVGPRPRGRVGTYIREDHHSLLSAMKRKTGKTIERELDELLETAFAVRRITVPKVESTPAIGAKQGERSNA